MNLFLISDTHFGHENIIRYCNRPFVNAAEMDERMVDNWNAVVRRGDHVYHLGDVALRRPHLAVMKRLNGRHRLVFGNHDIFGYKDYAEAGFEKMMGMRVLNGIILTHVPIHPGSLARFKVNVHGHTHGNSMPGRYINVCVELTNYRPVALEDVRKLAEAIYADSNPDPAEAPAHPCGGD